MPAQISSPALSSSLAPGPGFSLVADLAGAARLLRNLSGVGASGWVHRLASAGKAATCIQLTLASGETIAVQAIGQGRPVLMVHGLGGSHHDWDGAIQTLAQNHQVHSFDLLGHGARTRTQAHINLQQMANDVAEVIASLHLERPVLVGHSMGALVVMKYMQDHGAGNLAGVCLIDQSPRITTDEQWSLGLFGSLTRPQMLAALGRLRSDFVETVVSELVTRLSGLRGASGARGWRGRVLRWILTRLQRATGVNHVLAMLDSMVDADFRDVVAEVSVPTMVVLGGVSHHYGGLPLEQYYRDSLPDCTVRMYKASAHSPHRQEPGRFAADLSAFAAKRCA